MISQEFNDVCVTRGEGPEDDLAVARWPLATRSASRAT